MSKFLWICLIAVSAAYVWAWVQSDAFLAIIFAVIAIISAVVVLLDDTGRL